ncbi:hypothetical protein INN71_06830 [Nocardioides sp. ChNu-153]|uniref:hypothetical protein n=1 Tax=Nocardioides sp. ChNu-153 TaxID=2779364 RepID=UPI00265072DC|nr:hypothetical protein [Nocardioides sp. ChNu-153]MDN7121103.1 hypothetical protein [Nocardioides sp. ChNu-153]
MPDATAAASRRTSGGWGRVLVAVYAVLALAATGRSSVQLFTHAADAPVPYGLSALAALVYVAATLGLARPAPVWRRVAWVAVLVELVGVLAVGTVSVVHGDWFPDDTVWSRFGSGYGYLPLVLPFLGLAWLLRTRRPA